MRRTRTRRSPTRGGGGHASRGLIFEQEHSAPLFLRGRSFLAAHVVASRRTRSRQGRRGWEGIFDASRVPASPPRNDAQARRRDQGGVGAKRGAAEPSKGERMRKRRLDGWMRDEGVGRRMLKWGECRMKDGEGEEEDEDWGGRGGGEGRGRGGSGDADDR